jgi:transglutaminase-like putative cysteine protease
MKRSLLLVFFFSQILFAHRIELTNGKIIDTDSLRMENDSIYTTDTVLLRADVKSITFGEGGLEKGKEKLPEDIESIIENREKLMVQYSDFDGIIMLDKGINKLFTDGTRRYEYHFRGLILKDSKRTWATFQRYFDPEREKTRVDMARVIKSTGIIMPLDLNKVKITKPREEGMFFDRGKVISFTIPEVEVGDIVEYKYTEEIFNPWDKKIFTTGWFFGGSEPVIESAIKIIVPYDSYFNFVIKNEKGVKIDSLSTDSTRDYLFEKYNTLPPIEEPLMPVTEELVPFLRFSNQRNWNYIFNWYADFQKKRMKATEAIQRIADSLINGLNTHEEKTAALYHWIQRNIRYISIKGAASSGVSGHEAAQTLENGYGDCTDKAILFSTLLKTAGIEAYPVYLNTYPGPELIKKIPSFWGNHAIVEIFPKDSTHYFLDPVSEYYRYPSFATMDHGRDAICAQKSRIDYIPVPSPEKNRRNYKYSIEINASDSALVTFQSGYNGSYEAQVRAYWEKLTKEEKKKQFEQMSKRVSSNANLLDYELKNLTDISKPFKMTIKYEVPELLKKQGELYILKLPELEERYTKNELSLSNRNYDLIYDTSEEIINTYTILLPKEIQILSIPEKLSRTGKNAEYAASYTQKGDTLIFKDEWRRKNKTIKVSEYNNYRNLCNEVLNYTKRPVIMLSTGAK